MNESSDDDTVRTAGKHNRRVKMKEDEAMRTDRIFNEG